MNVLITGGNGLIGSHLAENLISKGYSVTLLDKIFNANTKELDCQKIHGDIRDYETVKEATARNDVIFHLAAVSRVIWGEERPYLCWTTNLVGTVNILETCRKMSSDKIIFYASSREVYGDSRSPLVKENHPKNPKSVYARSKLSGESACLSYHRSFGTKAIILRFSNVYGSERDQMDRVVPKFMINAMKNKDLVLYGGDQILDFNFIDDTVLGVTCALEKSLESDSIFGEDFHFVSGKGISINELTKMILKICGSSSKIVRLDPNDFEIKNFIGDQTKSRLILGFKSKTSLEEGLNILRSRLLL